jgi:AIPR protein
MNINASIIDQRLTIIQDEIRERASNELNISSPDKVFSLALVYLCAKTMLDLDDVEAFDCLTEGGGDFGIDAMHISEEYDGEFTISLFQGKYKRNLAADANYPENAINDLINAIRYIFNPSAQLNHINDQLLAQVENARSLIRDGYIPQVRALACNNGLCWNAAAQESIDRSGFGNQVTWEHVNHDRLVDIIRSTKPVNDNLQLTGQAIVEDMDFSRVLVGRISTKEIAALIDRHGERLLERNVRRYLGLQGNRVNEAIQTTLQSPERNNFYFYNNGITLTCDKFSYNALQKDDYQVRIENLQIINGGQTCMTIYKTLQQLSLLDETPAYVLVRLYQLPSENNDLVRRITFATNSQNPVDLRDLKANDDKQQSLEIDVQQLGYAYRRKRSDQGSRIDITSGVAAEAILSVWRQAPHQAKFFTREHFGKLYETVFTNDLNGAQLIIAVLLYRIAENRRRRPDPTDPAFVRYASCFIAMQMGKHLLDSLNVKLSVLNHQNFPRAVQFIEQNSSTYFHQALQDVEAALQGLYGEADVSLQQLSATFRRGDLIQQLSEISQIE